MQLRLHDKVCIITGATGGIGAAMARRLAAEGARLMLVDMHGTPLAAMAAELGADWAHADVASDAAVQAYTEQALARYGRIDAVLANAGTEGRVAPIVESRPEDVARLFAVNVFGPFSAIRHAAPHMRRGGTIIVTASVASFVGSPGLAPYCASKHALLGLVRSAAQELGPRGIRVNAIHPGPPASADHGRCAVTCAVGRGRTASRRRAPCAAGTRCRGGRGRSAA